MSQMSWVSLLDTGSYAQLNAGTALSNTTTLTDISAGGNNSGQAFTLPANYLQAGQQLRVRANGIVSTAGTPNLTLGVYLGGVAGTALATTGAVAAAASASAAPWILSADLRVEGAGTTGTVRTIGSVVGAYSSTAMLPSSSGTGNSVTVNTSLSQIMTIGAQWGTASTSNTITCYQFLVETLN